MRRFLQMRMSRGLSRSYAVSPYNTATDGLITAATSKSKVVVIDFSADWCGPCKAISPQFATLSDKYPDVKFFTVDVDNHSSVAQQFSVRAVPTFVVLKDGKTHGRVEGAAMAAVEEAIKKAI